MPSPLVVIWKAPSLRLACTRRASSRPLVGVTRRERVQRLHPWHCAPATGAARATSASLASGAAPRPTVALAPRGWLLGGVRVWQITSGGGRPRTGRPPPERANVAYAPGGCPRRGDVTILLRKLARSVPASDGRRAMQPAAVRKPRLASAAASASAWSPQSARRPSEQYR